MILRPLPGAALPLLVIALAGCGSKGTCQCFRQDGSSTNIETDGESCAELPSAANGFVSCEPVVPINSITGPGTDILAPASALPSLDGRPVAVEPPVTATAYLERPRRLR